MIPYFPAEGGRYRLSLGLRVLAPEDWIEIDDRYGDDLALKARVLRDHRDQAFQALDGSEDAQAAFMSVLCSHLAEHHSDRFRRADGALENRHTGKTVTPEADAPLRAAAGLVQEDVALLTPSPEGFRLIAALVCFPTRWNLTEKMGRPLAAIHGPVPGYAEKLERPMDRLFAGLTDDRLLWRTNFSLMDDPALYQPGGHFKDSAGGSLTPETIGRNMWFRVERQTLRRLPGSSVVAFTVRIHQALLERAVDSRERAADLLAAVDGMPETMKRYKSMPGFEPALRAWLEARASA